MLLYLLLQWLYLHLILRLLLLQLVNLQTVRLQIPIFLRSPILRLSIKRTVTSITDIMFTHCRSSLLLFLQNVLTCDWLSSVLVHIHLSAQVTILLFSNTYVSNTVVSPLQSHSITFNTLLPFLQFPYHFPCPVMFITVFLQCNIYIPNHLSIHAIHWEFLEAHPLIVSLHHKFQYHAYQSMEMGPYRRQLLPLFLCSTLQLRYRFKLWLLLPGYLSVTKLIRLFFRG